MPVYTSRRCDERSPTKPGGVSDAGGKGKSSGLHIYITMDPIYCHGLCDIQFKEAIVTVLNITLKIMAVSCKLFLGETHDVSARAGPSSSEFQARTHGALIQVYDCS